MMSVTEILKKNRKIDVKDYQFGMRIQEQDAKKKIDRTRIFNNPTFKVSDAVRLGYIHSSEKNKEVLDDGEETRT